MKLPLPQEPFAPLEPTPEQRAEFERVSDLLLRETLQCYDEYARVNKRVLDATRWKEVKRRENVTIYKSTQREYGGHAAAAAGIVSNVQSVIGVGTIAGQLDELMYGASSPDTLTDRLKTTYIKDEVVDNRVLCHVKYPSEDDPFRFLGVKWSAFDGFLQGLVVRPRDIFYLDSSGIHVLPDGERIGYIAYQSINLPGYGELASHGIVRTLLSSCYLYRQAANGTIELYLRSFINPGGKLMDSAAVIISTSSLIATWRFTMCAQHRKLAWMVREAQAERSRLQRSRESRDFFTKPESARLHSCPVCRKTLSAFRSVSTCEICSTAVCSRCVTTTKLTHCRSNAELVRVLTTICTSCVTASSRISGAEVAVIEQVPGARARRFAHRRQSEGPYFLDLMRDSANTSRSTKSSQRGSSDRLFASTSPSTVASTTSDAGSPPAMTRVRSTSEVDQAKHPIYSSGMPRCDESPKDAIAPYSRSVNSHSYKTSNVELMDKMNQLRIAAEHTYWQTLQTACAMQEAQVSNTAVHAKRA